MLPDDSPTLTGGDDTCPTTRTGGDRCPGALSPFIAEDGAIVRVRIPGGRVTSEAVRTLLGIGERHGSPTVHLTTRCNLQVRGLPTPVPDDVVDTLAGAGLLPSSSHEKARNVLAAPQAPELAPLVAALDAGIQADPDLAALPGRFLMAVTDASGTLLGEPVDLAYQCLTPSTGRIIVRRPEGLFATDCPPDRSVATMLQAARDFLAVRPDERTWNIRNLDAAALGALPQTSPLRTGELVTVTPPPPLEPGPAGEDLVVGLPLGLVTAEQLAAIETVCALAGTDCAALTPWRSIVIPGGAGTDTTPLEATGLLVSPHAGWARLSACTGAPHCARTTSPTQDIAREVAPQLSGDGPRVHLIGCERACGHPRGPHVSVLNPSTAADVLAALENAS